MNSRDIPTLGPSLHSRVASVSERSCEGPDSAKTIDDVVGRFHAPDVRILRTLVNVENVRHLSHQVHMQTQGTVGERFNSLRERAGISMDKLAKSLGLAGRSGLQRYLEPHYDPDGGLPADKLEGAIRALVGKGKPPITEEEVLALGAPLIQRSYLVAKSESGKLPPFCTNENVLKAIVEGLLQAYEKMPEPLRKEAPQVLSSALGRILLHIAEEPAIQANPDAIRAAVTVSASLPPFPTRQ